MPEFTSDINKLGDQFRERAAIIEKDGKMPTTKEAMMEIYCALGALSDAVSRKIRSLS